MKPVMLGELNMNTRAEAIAFLKSLWNGKPTACPICGNALEPLHKKAKKSDCDWQCRHCDKTFRTINLLGEINDRPPN